MTKRRVSGRDDDRDDVRAAGSAMSQRVRVRPIGPGPWRMCVVCRTVRRQDELVRFGFDEEGRIVVGPGRGRGAWVCVDRLASEHVAKSRATTAPARMRPVLERAFRRPVDDEAIRVVLTILAGPYRRQNNDGP